MHLIIASRKRLALRPISDRKGTMLIDSLLRRSGLQKRKNFSKEFLLKESKHFCMLPWTSLQIRPDGGTFPCCVSDDKGCLGNAKKQSLEKIWNSRKMREIRSKMLRDEPVKECTYCYQLEQNTEGSYRKRFNQTFAKNFDSLVPQTSDNGQLSEHKLLYWDFRLSNFCNFKCRSCSHLSSSSWHSDTLKLYGGSSYPKAVERVTDYRPQILDELLAHLPHVEEIYFAGGEPLMMEEHYQILEALVAAGRTDVRIWYNTNFSTLKYKGRDVVSYWNQFEEVKVQASLDGSGSRGEYLRKGQKWQKTEELRQRLLQECPQVHFEISATTSCYNVWHLPDFYKDWVSKGYLGADDFFFNPLYGPDYMRVQILPRSFRKEVVKKYQRICDEFVRTETMRTRFQNTMEWILSSDEEHLQPEFRKMTKKIDKVRNENFESVFPEISFLMGN